MNDKKSIFTDEVNDRLGKLFGKMDQSGAPTPDAGHLPQKDSNLFNLKVIVLSIEWEISDEIMRRLIEETDRLIKIYRDNKVVCSLLKLLHSVGRYIKARKATSHPDSIKLLHSIHANLQRVATSEIISESQSRQILSSEIAKFKNLQQQLLAKTQPPPLKNNKPTANTKTALFKSATSPEQPRPPVPAKKVLPAAAPDATIKGPKEDVLQAIDELKKLIQDEIQSLREEIKQIRR